jgi:Zn finger protein HypA/HybF involved in hydrogenase expression
MHEFGMVDDFIHQLVESHGHGSKKPCQVIRVGYGPGLKEEYLRQAFQVHAMGTRLEKVRFEFIKNTVQIPCECGAILKEDEEPAGVPYVVCSKCQSVRPIPGFDVLELIDVA